MRDGACELKWVENYGLRIPSSWGYFADCRCTGTVRRECKPPSVLDSLKGRKMLTDPEVARADGKNWRRFQVGRKGRKSRKQRKGMGKVLRLV